MRIDCEQCGAAFNIDDAVISDRGVRAQCPKCGHQKVVKKPVASADPFAGLSGAASAAPNPFGTSGASPFGAPSAPTANPFAALGTGDGPTMPNVQNPFAPSAAPTQPSGNPFATATASNPFASATQPGATQQSATQPSASPFAATSPAPVTAVHNTPVMAPSSNPFGSAVPFGGASPAPSPFGSAPPTASPFGSAPPTASPFGAAPSTVSPFASAAPSTASPFGGAPSTASPFGGAPSTASPFGNASPSTAAPFGGGAFGSPSFGAPGGNIGLEVPNTSAGLTRDPAPVADPFAAFGASTQPAPGAPASLAPKPPSADPFDALAARQVRAPMVVPSAPDPFANASIVSAPTLPVDDPFARLDLGDAPTLATASPPSTMWRLKTRAGMDAEVDLPSLREMVRSGSVTSQDEAAPVGQAMKPVAQWPMLNVAAPPTLASPARVSGARARGGGGLPRAALLVIPVLLIGAVAALWVLKPEIFESSSDAGLNPLRRAKPTWAKQFPDVSGTASDHLNAGRQQMRLDTAAGYRKADEELRQALLVDIGNVSAIAAWVENFANLPAVKADLEQANLAEEAVSYAARKDPESTDVMRAQAALKLAHGDVDGAQKVLEVLNKKAPNDVAAYVILARTHLDREAQDALDVLETQVKPKDPDLKSALVVEGAAHRRLGNFKAARDVLNGRLTSDPQNTGALKELAKLELDVGNPEEAIAALTRLIQAEERDVEAHLMRARIAYQSPGVPDGLKRADGFLDEVLAKHESSAGELLLPVLSHAAFVKGELGNLDKAQALAERARATDGNFAPALFVLGRIYASKGDNEGARKSLEAAVRAAQARDSFFEPTARAELAGAQAAGGDAQGAIRNYEQVLEFDPRDTRAHFGLGATYMRNDKATQAMTIMRRALQNDPNHHADRRVLTDYPTATRDLVVLADIFKKAKVPADDPSLAALKIAAEGMIRYHAGQRAEAKGLFEDALREDRFNHSALFHLGVMAIEDGLPAEAKRKLGLAIETTGKGHAMTQLYMARAELGSGEPEAARKRLTDLLGEEPSLVQAQYSLAMALRALKLDGQATEELKKVVKSDQDFMPAKRALVQ